MLAERYHSLKISTSVLVAENFAEASASNGRYCEGAGMGISGTNGTQKRQVISSSQEDGMSTSMWWCCACKHHTTTELQVANGSERAIITVNQHHVDAAVTFKLTRRSAAFKCGAAGARLN